jgi:hypothetical protein
MNRVSEINPAGGNFVPDGDFKIAAPGQSHYGMAQKYIGGFVANSRRLPVEVVMWTALEGKGEEGKNLSGPLLPGRKLAETAGQWFNHNLHLDAIPKKDNKGLLVKDSNGMVEFERKLYLQAHYPLDSPNMMYLAKTSVPKGGEMPLVIDASMQKFFELYNLAIETSKKAILG